MILTAKEMREVTLPPRLKKVEKEKEQVYKQILKQAKRGKFTVCVELLYPETVNYFQSLGYDIYYSGMHGYTKISWKEINDA